MEPWLLEVGLLEVGLLEVGLVKVGLVKVGLPKVGLTHPQSECQHGSTKWALFSLHSILEFLLPTAMSVVTSRLMARLTSPRSFLAVHRYWPASTEACETRMDESRHFFGI